jgi:hypothetical protein
MFLAPVLMMVCSGANFNALQLLVYEKASVTPMQR